VGLSWQDDYFTSLSYRKLFWPDLDIPPINLNNMPKIEPGTKYDQEKPRVDLLDPLALEGIANVLAFGARKYAAHNWRGGISYSRLLGAILRHTFAILKGEDTDPESGLPHVDHLGCSVLFLSNMMKTRPDMDDRWKDSTDNRYKEPK
jgi:hypothetical protein